MKYLAPLTLILPGLLVAATGVGAGDLATAAFTGQHLGVAVLWAVIVGAVFKFAITEGLTRWQLATGTTLLEGAMDRLGWAARILFAIYLLMWSYFVGAALISVNGVVLHSMCPIFDDAQTGKQVFGVIASVAGVLIVRLGGFKPFEWVMSVCIAVMFVTVIATAALMLPPWPELAGGLLTPRIPDAGGEGLGWTIALMGGVGGTLTVLCYGYWIREHGRTSIGTLWVCRVDLLVSYAATALFGMAMVVIGSHLAQDADGRGIGLIVGLAGHLQAQLGAVGRWLFLIGAWCAVFSSMLGVWQSVPYLAADYWGMLARGARSQQKVGDRGVAYRFYLYALGLIPLAGLFFDFKQVQKIYAVFGAAFMPVVALVLLILCNHRGWMRTRRNTWLANVVLVIVLAFFSWVLWR